MGERGKEVVSLAKKYNELTCEFCPETSGLFCFPLPSVLAVFSLYEHRRSNQTGCIP